MGIILGIIAIQLVLWFKISIDYVIEQEKWYVEQYPDEVAKEILLALVVFFIPIIGLLIEIVILINGMIANNKDKISGKLSKLFFIKW